MRHLANTFFLCGRSAIVDHENLRMEMDMEIVAEALARGDKALNEHDSKKVLQAYRIPVTREVLVADIAAAQKAAAEMGFPVVLKGASSTLTHKTELNLVELNIKDGEALEKAYNGIRERGGAELDGVLVQEMVQGDREFVVGLVRDPQFGPCVMFGLGGIFTEVLKDVTFRVAPFTRAEALEMMDEIRSRNLLGEFRGKPAVNKDVLADILVSVGQIGLELDEIAEIDLNPLIIKDDAPVAVDALIVLKQ